ncbi:MAG: divergent PAP2 family protein [Kiritimatiellae bacterium]|nr:divergent PAP2 family protein [Kiritimatiellia bacterium]
MNLGNHMIVTAAVGWFVAQSLKLSINLAKTRQIDFRYFVSTGGMPSAHSAAVSALATAVGLQEGFTGTLFGITVVFAAIVMFDAQSVRRATGQQARILNQIVQELFQEHHLSRHKLAELLGHTRLEVFAGMFLGIATALAMAQFT